MRISSSFYISLLRPVIQGPLESGVANPTLPGVLEVEGAPTYRARSILDSRQWQEYLQYLLDWQGYGSEECSWVPARDMLSRELVEEFHALRPDRPALCPRGHPPRPFSAPVGCPYLRPGAPVTLLSPFRGQS